LPSLFVVSSCRCGSTYWTDYAKMSGAMLALAQACSRGVSMAPKTHNLAVYGMDA